MTDSNQLAGLLKLAASVMQDGAVSHSEADDLRQWMRAHPDLLIRFPGKNLAEVLMRVLRDGKLQDHEREELGALLEQLTD